MHLAQSRRYREFPEGADDVFEVNANATVQAARLGPRGRRHELRLRLERGRLRARA